MKPLWKRFYWVPIALLFLILRLFSGYPFYHLGGDACNYLALARSFPKHLLYNRELYLFHPPLLGYLIASLAPLFTLENGAIALSVICGLLVFFWVKKIGEELEIKAPAIALALLYLSLCKAGVVYENSIGRSPPLIFFYCLSFQTFLSWMKQRSGRFPYLCLLSTALALWTSDQALILFPCFMILYGMRGHREGLRALLRLMLYAFLMALPWPLVRWHVYLTHSLYPAGGDGMIEWVQNYNLKTILQPAYFPFNKFFVSQFTNIEFKAGAFNFREIFTVPFRLVFMGKNSARLLLALILIPGFVRAVRAKDRDFLGLVLLSGLLYLPCLFGMHDWYGLGYMIPFSLLLGKSLNPLVERSPRSGHVITLGIGLISVMLSAVWLIYPFKNNGFHHYRPIGGRYFLFSRQPVTRGRSFAKEILDPLPDVGFMGPVGLTPELLYLTGKRFVALPFDPLHLEALIDFYEIGYLIFSSENLGRTADIHMDLAMTRVTAEYIQAHPEKFELVVNHLETYPAIFSPRTFYLYRVRKIALP